MFLFFYIFCKNKKREKVLIDIEIVNQYIEKSIKEVAELRKEINSLTKNNKELKSMVKKISSNYKLGFAFPNQSI